MKKLLLMAVILPFFINCKDDKPGISKDEEDKILLEIKAMENANLYSDSAMVLLDSNMEDGRVKKEIVDRHILLLKKSIESAKKVDIATLERIKKGLGNKYKAKYIRGLELQIEGFQQIDSKKSLEGQILYDEYVNFLKTSQK